jgi:uncharacterized membrane protein
MLPFWLYFGIVLLLFVAFLALVFVPMLMMEENVTFVEATRLSYRAYMTNWLSLTIYSLTPLGIILGLALPMGISHLVIGEAGTVTGLLDVVASLPLLIGLIAMWPAMTLFTFVFYDAIFGAKTTPSLEIASNSNAEPAIL